MAPDDQNSFSKREDCDLMDLKRTYLSNMIAQLQNEASSSRIMTIFTTKSALRNIPNTDRSCMAAEALTLPATSAESTGVTAVSTAMGVLLHQLRGSA